MKKITMGLCALLTCCLLVAPTPADAAQVAELSMINGTVVTPERTIILESYQHQSLAVVYLFQQYLQLTTPVNSMSLGGDLQFTATEDKVTVYVSALTDLDGDGYYEWLDSTSGTARQLVGADGSLLPGDTTQQTMAAGEQRTLSAAALLQYGMAAEQARMADGTTPLYGLSLVTSGDILYCITLESRAGESQSYYVQLDYSLDTSIPVSQLGAGAFSDVPSWAWYWDEVDWAVRAGILNGVSDTQFQPEGTTTRAALMQVLYLQAGAPATNLALFSDVAATDWYAAAVSWGYKEGLVSGYSDGSFQPNTDLTREQLAVIVYQAAQLAGQSTDHTTSLAPFTDGASTSSWAKTAFSWAIATGVLDEEEGGLLNPQGSVSRATLASVLMAMDGLA